MKSMTIAWLLAAVLAAVTVVNSSPIGARDKGRSVPLVISQYSNVGIANRNSKKDVVNAAAPQTEIKQTSQPKGKETNKTSIEEPINEEQNKKSDPEASKILNQEPVNEPDQVKQSILDPAKGSVKQPNEEAGQEPSDEAINKKSEEPVEEATKKLSQESQDNPFKSTTEVDGKPAEEASKNLALDSKKEPKEQSQIIVDTSVDETMKDLGLKSNLGPVEEKQDPEVFLSAVEENNAFKIKETVKESNKDESETPAIVSQSQDVEETTAESSATDKQPNISDEGSANTETKAETTAVKDASEIDVAQETPPSDSIADKMITPEITGESATLRPEDLIEEDRSFKNSPEEFNADFNLATLPKVPSSSLEKSGKKEDDDDDDDDDHDDAALLDNEDESDENESVRLDRVERKSDDKKERIKSKEKEKKKKDEDVKEKEDLEKDKESLDKVISKPIKEGKPNKKPVSDDPVKEYDDARRKRRDSDDDAEASVTDKVEGQETQAEDAPVVFSLVPSNYPVVLLNGESALSDQIKLT